MKKISVMVPCYNEEENVVPISEAIVGELTKLSKYDYEILFIDNCSTDGTRPLLREICRQNPKIRAIFNSKNFGQFNSPFYGICQTSGDCTISICADFQDPVEMIPKFIKAWEDGYKIVCGIKTSSQENPLVYKMRSWYYKLMKKMSTVDQIEQFTGFGLYDKSFVDVLRNLDDPAPFIRGIVAELGPKRMDIPYEQPRRRAGHTHNNWYSLYDATMLSFTSYTKFGLRMATFGGAFFAALGALILLVLLVMKLCNWQGFAAGMWPVYGLIVFFGGAQTFFLGFLGEYVMNIKSRVMRRPLVVEEERINFEAQKDSGAA